MPHSLFNHLDILSLVADLTDPKDHLRCLRVSKTFHSVFIKHVWRTAEPDMLGSTSIADSAAEVYQKHSHLVRDLQLVNSKRKNWDREEGHFLLENLIYRDETSQDPETQLGNTILECIASPASCLQSITMITECIPPEWLKALIAGPPLKQLTISGRYRLDVRPEDVEVFLQACARAQELFLQDIYFDSDPDTLNDPDYATGAELDFSAVQRLTFGCSYQDFGIGITGKHPKSQTHLDTLLTDLQAFKYLHAVIDEGAIRFTDRELTWIILSLPSLRVLRADSCSFGPTALTALRTKLSPRDTLGSPSRPCDTLEGLHLEGATVRRSWLKMIVSYCGALKEFTTPTLKPEDIIRASRGRHWACEDALTMLKLHVQWESDDQQDATVRKCVMEEWTHMCEVVEDLKNVETLIIVGVRSEWSVNFRTPFPVRLVYFDPLRELKKLRRFELRSVYGYQPGIVDLKFLIQEWEELEEIWINGDDANGVQWEVRLGKEDIRALRAMRAEYHHD